MPERRKAPPWMIRVYKTLVERIGRLAEQNHRTIRAQASLLLEAGLEGIALMDAPREAPRPYWMPPQER